MDVQMAYPGTEVERIGDQLHRAFYGGAWHGPSVEEVLDGVTATRAAARPLKNAHSIWEIALHIAVWEDVVRRRLMGTAVKVTPAQDWPKIDATDDKAWRGVIERLIAGHEALAEVVAGLKDEQLANIVPGKQQTFYYMLHGIIQHDLYHAGQVAVLKKS